MRIAWNFIRAQSRTVAGHLARGGLDVSAHFFVLLSLYPVYQARGGLAELVCRFIALRVLNRGSGDACIESISVSGPCGVGVLNVYIAGTTGTRAILGSHYAIFYEYYTPFYYLKEAEVLIADVMRPI